MKKRFLAAALALVLAIGLAIPAFAADESSSGVPAVDVHLPGGGSTEASTGTYQVRRASAMALTDKTTGTTLGHMITRSSEPQAFELTVYPLPLGTTITISNLRNDWKSGNHMTDIVGIQAYSDPDGDGVYDQWMFDFEQNPPVHPLAEDTLSYPPSENGRYNTAGYLTKDNTMDFGISDTLPSSVTLSTEYLHNVFGPNTLVLVQLQVWTAVNTEPLTAFQTGTTATLGYLITGETAPDAPAADSPTAPDTPSPASTDFTDVAPGAYYAAPVAWAVEKEITTGTGDNKFSPGKDCTNAQILTFIWRAYGKPEPTIDNPFTNSISDAYQKAAIWAYEKGLVSGTTFDAGKPCTRAMAMMYLWQAAGSPDAPAGGFTDVPADADYAPAVAWAVEQEITTGTGDGTTFSPNDVCSRGQIMAFLYRNLA